MNPVNVITRPFVSRAACFIHLFVGTIALSVVAGCWLGDHRASIESLKLLLFTYPFVLIRVCVADDTPLEDPARNLTAAICCCVGIVLVVAGLYNWTFYGLGMHYWGLGCFITGAGVLFLVKNRTQGVASFDDAETQGRRSAPVYDPNPYRAPTTK